MILHLALACFAASSDKLDPTAHFGLSIASAGDLDGDGVPDLLIGDGSRHEDDNGPGRVWVISGGDGRVLDLLLGRNVEEGQPARFGLSLATLGDLDRDGVPDFVVGAYGDGSRSRDKPRGTRMGFARVYSGRDRRVLREFIGDRTDDGFGCSVAAAGDIDRDGTPDIVIGASGSPQDDRHAGYVRILSGRDGSVLRTVRQRPDSWLSGLFDREPKSWIRFGSSIVNLGDLDADGIPDLAIGVPGSFPGRSARGSVEVFSASTGEALFTIDRRRDDRGNMALGGAIARLGDVNSDGVCDFLVSRIDVAVWICSGKDGSTIREIEDPGRYGYLRGFGHSLAALGDLDGDGVPDFAVGCEEDLDSGDQYDATVFSGRDGSELGVLEAGHEFVVVAAAGDVDGDGVPDVLASRWESGQVKVISGRTGETLRTIRRPPEIR